MLTTWEKVLKTIQWKYKHNFIQVNGKEYFIKRTKHLKTLREVSEYHVPGGWRCAGLKAHWLSIYERL